MTQSGRATRGGDRGRGARDSKKPRKPKPDYSNLEELKPTLEPPAIEAFTEWDLGDDIQGAIAQMGITTPTPVQKLAIGPVLEGRDVIAKAETGTGKTLAFGAPMMAKIEPGRSTVLGLVLAPTRELAQQVAQVLEELGKARGVNVVLVVGGDPMGPQIKALQDGAQVVVGTPGRVLDLLNQRFLSLPWTEFCVLDEADEMLEIGFLPDVEKILDRAPEERQTLLFSATFPPALLSLARKHTTNPYELATAKGVATIDNIDQRVVFLESDEDRGNVLKRAIERSRNDDLMLAFGDRRTEVDRLMRRLDRLPMGVKALHGGYDQPSRFRVMSAFREGAVRALVATDVASRGLDVTGVSHVINLGVPREVSSYTHRIGRTGRAGRDGKAITFVQPADRRRWRELAAQMTWEVEEIAEADLYTWMFDGEEARGGRGDRPRGRSRDEQRGGRGRDEPRERRPRREAGEPAEAPAAEASDGERPRRRSSRPVSDRPLAESRDGERQAESPERRPRRQRSSAAAPREDAPQDEARPPRRERSAERAPERTEPVEHVERPAEAEGGTARPRKKVRLRSSLRGAAETERPAEGAPEPRPRRRSRAVEEPDAPEPRAPRSARRDEPGSESERPRRTRTRSSAPADSGGEGAPASEERPRRRARSSSERPAGEERPAAPEGEAPRRSRSSRRPEADAAEQRSEPRSRTSERPAREDRSRSRRTAGSSNSGSADQDSFGAGF